MTWVPFRPTVADKERIGRDVATIPDLQRTFLAKADGLKVADRVAHQYQIAGSRVSLRIAPQLPDNLNGVGLFVPDTEHRGLARVSTGLGCPHLETDPDFIGLAVVFMTPAGRRVDLLAINHPAAPSPNHPDFMTLMHAATDGLGVTSPVGSGWGGRNLPDLIASNIAVTRGLIRRMGLSRGLGATFHLLKQTLLPTAFARTAYQSFWTGILEAGGAPGKIVFVPQSDENGWNFRSGPRHLTEEWRRRQARGPVVFRLYWLPYIGESATPTVDMTANWEERRQLVGTLTFPQADLTGEDARLWAALTIEMGVNPANWIASAQDDPPDPGTEFGVARKIAYRISQEGRGVLPEAAYAHVFSGAPIGAALAAELARRRAAKKAAGHVDMAA